MAAMEQRESGQPKMTEVMLLYSFVLCRKKRVLRPMLLRLERVHIARRVMKEARGNQPDQLDFELVSQECYLQDIQDVSSSFELLN